jgi:hypothetical protein
MSVQSSMLTISLPSARRLHVTFCTFCDSEKRARQVLSGGGVRTALDDDGNIIELAMVDIPWPRLRRVSVSDQTFFASKNGALPDDDFHTWKKPWFGSRRYS